MKNQILKKEVTYEITTMWFADNSSLTYAHRFNSDGLVSSGFVVCVPQDKFEKNFAIMKSKGLADKAFLTKKSSDENIRKDGCMAYNEMRKMKVKYRSLYLKGYKPQ